MSLARWIAFGIIGCEAAILGEMTGEWLMPGTVCVAAFVGAWGRFVWNPNRDRRIVLGLALAFAFLGWYVAYLSAQKIPSMIFTGNIGVLMGQYFLALQAMQLFYRHDYGVTPYLPFFGVVTLSFAGDVTLYGEPGRVTYYFSLALAFAFLSAFFFALAHPRLPRVFAGMRWKRYGWLVLTLALSALLAWSTGRFLKWLEGPANNLAADLFFHLPPPSLNHSDVSRLGSIPKLKENEGRGIALHIVADEEPGYLRSRVYEEYGQSEWHLHAQLARVNPSPPPPGVAVPPGEDAFSLTGTRSEKYTRFEIHPNRSIRTSMHTPLDTAWLTMGVERVLVDPYGAVHAEANLEGQEYIAYAAEPEAAPLSPENRAIFTQLPENLDPRVRALSEQVCGGRESDLARTMAVSQYFNSRYKYHLGVQIPVGEDPITYFLFHDPPLPAHCEFFASGAALLLRAAGVPCRYVGGVVVSEKARFGDYWIARNRDAHAWVEAFVANGPGPDAPGRWMVVEATPADGVPGEVMDGRGSAIGDFVDALKFHVGQLFARLRSGDWLGGLRAAVGVIAVVPRWLLTTWLGWVTLLLLGTAGWRIARLRRGRRRRKRVRAAPAMAAMAALLRQADARVRRRGLKRAPQETVCAFARRVEAEPEATAFAAWYRAYAAARFGEDVTEAGIARLRSLLPRG